MKALIRALAIAAVAAWAQAGYANDQLDYERRAGARLATLHDSLDRNRDAFVTAEEARGDLHFVPVFDDIDVNRDGSVTREEVGRYLEHRYGPHAADAAREALGAKTADSRKP